jgi:hypothetical protein
VYDDNVRLDIEEDSASSFRVIPRLFVEARTEVAKTALDAYVAYTDYDEDEVVVEDKRESSAFLRSERRTSERGTIGLNGQYRRETLFKQIDFGPGVGNPEDVDVALTTFTDVRRYYRVVEPYGAWRMTERTAVRLTYRDTNVNFSEGEGTGAVDYQNSRLTALLSHVLTERTEALLAFDVARFDPETEVESDTLKLVAGVRRAFTESLRGTLSAGASRTDTETAGGDDSSSGFVFSGELEQRAELSRLDGLISHDITPSGSGQVTETDQIRIRWHRQIGPQLFFLFRALLLDTKVLEGSDPGIDRRYYDIEPRIEWRWLEDWSITGSYRYRRQKFDAATDAASSNEFIIGIMWQPII